MTPLLLLRHGDITASHRGDVPVTGTGLAHETAQALARGIDAPAGVTGPVDSFVALEMEACRA